MKKMLLMGYYGSRNLGDEMMFHCLRRWLMRQGVGVTLFCENSAETSDRLQVAASENIPLLFEWAWRDAWFRGKAVRTLREFPKTQGLIVGGGDLIRDDRGWRVFMFAVEKILLALALRRPVFLLNVGIGKPVTWYGRHLLFWLLRRCRQIVVRDARSMEVCREARAGATLAPDIVIHLPDWTEGWRNAQSERERPYMVVCLRANPNVFGGYALGDAGLANLAAALDDVAARNGLKIVFLPFQCEPHGEDDSEIHVALASRMNPASVGCIREWTHDVAEVTRCIAGAACVVAMRLHAAILAVACRRPCVVMPYDYKVSEAAQMFHIAEQVTPAVLADRSAIVSSLERALQSGERGQRDGSSFPISWNSISLDVSPARGRAKARRMRVAN